jgi:cyclopropane fatty-acyl-phospholipid synthase-like methyltransferase
MLDLNNEAYLKWKGWGPPDASTAAEKRTWDLFHRLLGSTPGTRLLEIGFGSGSHLFYCRTKNIEAFGVEENLFAIERADKNGLAVRSSLDEWKFAPQSIDAAMALDVFEHIPLTELVDLMTELEKVLKPAGRLLITVPNGASPFGRLQQHGDLTHINAFTQTSLEQLGVLTGWRVRHFAEVPEYFRLDSPMQWVKYPVWVGLRWIARTLVRVYVNAPVSPAVVCVFEKASASPYK